MGARRGWYAVLLPIPYALLAAALLEWLSIPSGVLFGDPVLALHASALSVGAVIAMLWPMVALQALVVLAALLVSIDEARRRVTIGICVVVAAVATLQSYWILVDYHRFAGYLPFIAAWSVLGVLLAAAYVVAAAEVGPRLLRLGIGAAALAGALAAAYVDATRFRGEYPTLNGALLSVVVLLAHAGAACLLSRRAAPRRLWLAPAPGVALALVALLVTALTPDAARANAYLREYTTMAQLRGFRGEAVITEECLDPPAEVGREEADALFRRYSGLPELPAGFRVTDYNVLLVLFEATRYDGTSLSGRPNATPNLQRLVDAGAFAFHSAHSPATRTFTSMAALFDLTYPSHARMRTKVPPWVGELEPEAETPAELFAAAGYRTFRVGYEIPHYPPMKGLWDGFEVDEGHATDGELERHVDELIAASASAKLEELAASGDKFFGFVGLFSPHAPYTRRDGVTAQTPEELYYAEIQHLDAQFGAVVNQLFDTGLLDKTIVIVMADHGEEFGEHGFYASHGRTLFGFATHVPMVVRVPGVPGRAMQAPTSEDYVLPWLLATGEGDMQRVAVDRIQHHFAPMMKATGGAVIVELYDWTSRMSALNWADASVQYNYASRLARVFDLAHDPAEQHDLAVSDPDAAAPYLEALDRYRAVRACHRRAEITRERATRTNITDSKAER